MPEVSFDFRKYIDQRKGADEALAHAGAAYAYPADQKVLRTLARVTPVTLAVEATVRLWKSRAGRELLENASRVNEKQHPELYQTACQCAERLRIVLPALYLVPELPGEVAYTFGASDDAAIVLDSALVERLSPEEQRFVIGHECGRVQNNHVLMMTALYYLSTSANQFVRWIVKPAALALRSWSRRAAISADRAGLICSGALIPSVSALLRLELRTTVLPAGLDPQLYLDEVDEERAGSAHAELQRAHPEMRARVLALRLFSETHYFLKASSRKPREEEGKSLAWCDERVKKILSRLPKEDKSRAGD